SDRHPHADARFLLVETRHTVAKGNILSRVVRLDFFITTHGSSPLEGRFNRSTSQDTPIAANREQSRRIDQIQASRASPNAIILLRLYATCAHPGRLDPQG